jgi:Fe-S-cluster containining protein
VCCSSGWAIPVEAPLHRSLNAAIEWGQLRIEGAHRDSDLFEPAPHLTDDDSVVLRRRANGACVFFEPERGNLCAIQRQIDHAHLPSACRHFPRVVVIDPRGTFVTLSHVCPTAARLLLVQGTSAEVVVRGPAIDGYQTLEGLDARDALPPLVRPEMLWDWDSWDRWERGAVAMLARDGQSPEEALHALDRAVEAVSVWRPADGPLEDAVDSALAEAARSPRAALVLEADRIASLCAIVDRSVPEALKPAALAETPRFDVPGWDQWGAALCRYLAARAFANWVGYYGTGLKTWRNSILAAYAVLRAAAARHAEQLGGPLDAGAVLKVFGEADLLLLHLASAPAMAAALDDWEER